MHIELEIRLRPMPDYGSLMTYENFLKRVDSGLLIDYDGYGYLATEEEITDIKVYPSIAYWIMDEMPELKIFTHVLWFNR